MILSTLTMLPLAPVQARQEKITHVAQRKLGKVPLQVVVASNSTIRCNDKELLIFRPAKPSY